MSDKTNLYNVEEFNQELVKRTLYEVINILKERGYNAQNQLIGYLISGDPGYISSYKDARKKICSIDRVKIMELLLQKYLEK